LGEGDRGDGSPIVGAAAGCGRRITSVPLTGPRQVSPVNGIRRVFPLSSIVPLPLSVNGQFGMPGMLAVPVAVNVTAVPLSVPDALPEIVRPPPHFPVNVPEMDEDV
jgi:hypothetical protein